MPVPVTVYAESTPNPSAMKFVASIPLLYEGAVEFNSREECQSSPLATGLFAFSGVKSVFISANFVTVTKDSEIDWYEITGIIREYIRGYLMDGGKAFTSNPFTGKNERPHQAASEQKPDVSSEYTETETQIIRMLDEYVKPAVEQDGGAIHFRSFSEGVVTVALKGSCSGCPSSTMTLKAGIENLLKQMVPEVKEVVAEAE